MFCRNFVHSSIVGRISVLEVENPPVNAYGRDVRASLIELINDAENDPNIQAHVLMGHNDIFCGGADITEFDGPLLDPQFPELIHVMEGTKKPIIAAISGFALGVGLRLH